MQIQHCKFDYQQAKLWEQISDFDLDDDEADFMFSDRLAKEQGWQRWFTLRAIEEYKKFMFLICVTGNPLTPSEEVDQVWHLHLLYTRSYWKEFCGEVLKREIHHGPTRGGPEEYNKFIDWYAQTLYHYRNIFQSEPPSDLWPSPTVRFKPSSFRRIDTTKYLIIKIKK